MKVTENLDEAENHEGKGFNGRLAVHESKLSVVFTGIDHLRIAEHRLLDYLSLLAPASNKTITG